MKSRPGEKTAAWIGFLLAMMLSLGAAEGACKEDALAHVKGGTLAMSSGAVYQVESPSIDIALWLPPTGVTICERTDMNGQSYYAIRNKDANETVPAVREQN